MKAGALKGNSPCEVVQQCDITFCCVADTTAVKDVSSTLLLHSVALYSETHYCCIVLYGTLKHIIVA